ncbi:hypothetical protein GCM10027414_29110 [Humibacter ginsengiterrae]
MVHGIPATGIFDAQSMIDGAGPWALIVVCGVVFAETGLLLGFFLPGDTLLFFAGVMTLTGHIRQPLWLVIVLVGAAAAIGGQVGYLIGWRSGPAVFDRRESGFFSRTSVERTHRFFDRFGAASILLARFVPVVRTFAPVAAGVGKMRGWTFTILNIAGAYAWAAAVTIAGFLLGQVPGVADFVSRYIDMVLIAIVVLSVGPLLLRVILVRRARLRKQAGTPADESPETAGSRR